MGLNFNQIDDLFENYNILVDKEVDLHGFYDSKVSLINSLKMKTCRMTNIEYCSVYDRLQFLYALYAHNADFNLTVESYKRLHNKESDVPNFAKGELTPSVVYYLLKHGFQVNVTLKNQTVLDMTDKLDVTKVIPTPDAKDVWYVNVAPLWEYPYYLLILAPGTNLCIYYRPSEEMILSDDMMIYIS